MKVNTFIMFLIKEENEYGLHFPIFLLGRQAL